jgi:hypothetical protein
VITASGEIQYALEGDSVDKIAEPSLFTRHVIEGIGTGAADLDGDGQITSDELYRYVLTQMGVGTDSAGNNLLRRQRPQRWVFKLDGPDLVVALNPAPRPAALPAEIVALSQHELPSLRLDAVLRLQVLLGSDSAPHVRAARGALERLQNDPNPAVSAAAARILQEAGGVLPSRQEGTAVGAPGLPAGPEPAAISTPSPRARPSPPLRDRGWAGRSRASRAGRGTILSRGEASDTGPGRDQPPLSNLVCFEL